MNFISFPLLLMLFWRGAQCHKSETTNGERQKTTATPLMGQQAAVAIRGPFTHAVLPSRDAVFLYFASRSLFLFLPPSLPSSHLYSFPSASVRVHSPGLSGCEETASLILAINTPCMLVQYTQPAGAAAAGRVRTRGKKVLRMHTAQESHTRWQHGCIKRTGYWTGSMAAPDFFFSTSVATCGTAAKQSHGLEKHFPRRP